MNKNVKNNYFIKTDDNKIINENFIRWVKKMNDCLEVCTKLDGCMLGINTHKICSNNNKESFDLLNKYFE